MGEYTGDPGKSPNITGDPGKSPNITGSRQVLFKLTL